MRNKTENIQTIAIGVGSNLNVVGVAKVFNGGICIGRCLDTPNAIKAALAAITQPDYPFVKNCFGELVS